MLSDLTITPLSHSGEELRFVISNGECFFEANELTAELISALKEAGDIDRGIDSFTATHEIAATHDELKEFIVTQLVDKLSNPVRQKQFLYQKELISGSMMSKFSTIACGLFKPRIMMLLTAVGIAAEILFFVNTSNFFRFGMATDWWVVMCILIFVVASSAIHELGHATACRYFGIGHGGVGFGLHFNFPVFYTDVSQAWTLSRRKRCVINIAGIYFQLILVIVLTAGYFATRNDLLRYMIVAINMSFFLTLNPFFKFDGYWLASDMMGITNLRAKTSEMLLYCRQWICRKSDRVKPEIMRLPRRVRYIAMSYTVCVNLFFGYFFFYMIPMFFVSMWHQLPGQLRELTYFLSHRMVPPFATLMNLVSELIFTALIAYMVYGMTKGLWKKKKPTTATS